MRSNETCLISELARPLRSEAARIHPISENETMLGQKRRRFAETEVSADMARRGYRAFDRS